MERLSDTVYVHTVEVQGFTVCSVVLVGGHRLFVFDTLDRPQAMAPVRELVDDIAGERRVIVVNSHHHWDHVYGNALFADHDIVAHRSCRRLILTQGRSADESLPPEPDEGVPVPAISFGDRLTYADEISTVHLIHTPGHSEDSIILYYDEEEILLAGDTVEWPLPSFSQRDAEAVYVRTLRQLKQLPIRMIVPAHGPVMGKELIDANQSYIEGVYEAVREAKVKGVPRHDLDLPPDRFLAPGVTLDHVSEEAHRENVSWAYDDV